MQALGNMVIIKRRDDKEQKSESGLTVIRQDTHGEAVLADVISVGKDVKEIKKADVVMVLQGMGVTFEKDYIQYVELPEHEIMAVVED